MVGPQRVSSAMRYFMLFVPLHPLLTIGSVCLDAKKIKTSRILTILVLLQCFCVPLLAMDNTNLDEIDFFNVGQGHAVLINQVGRTPLLIDAGSSMHCYEVSSQHRWEKAKPTSSILKISNRVIEFWDRSNLQPYCLNVIITHQDKDHKNFLLDIFRTLMTKAQFGVSLLLGGEEETYANFLKECPVPFPNLYYSQDNLGMFRSFFKDSPYITHLFCPKGQSNANEDDNSWSIITRIEINGISAILTGDADYNVKEEMLKSMNAFQMPWEELGSDLLLVPHHGAENTYHTEWDANVNSKAIIIGSAPNGDVKGYRHPRGNTILKYLSPGCDIWKGKVQQHGIQYWAMMDTHNEIKNLIIDQNRLFNDTSENNHDASWHLIWVDLPIYTLWTTGTLYFTGNLDCPCFIEAPHGLMNYIAVDNPELLFSPEIRKCFSKINQGQQDYIRHKVSQIIENETIANWHTEQVDNYFKQPYNLKKRIKYIPENIKELLKIEYVNEMLSHVLLVKSEDRQLFLNVFNEIFETTEKKTDKRLQVSSNFFGWLRDAVTERNLNIDPAGDRLITGVHYLFGLSEAEEKKLEGESLIIEKRTIAENEQKKCLNDIDSGSQSDEDSFETKEIKRKYEGKLLRKLKKGVPEWSKIESMDDLFVNIRLMGMEFYDNHLYELDYKILILKLFSKTFCTVEKLGKYITAYKTIAAYGPTPEGIDSLCPKGFTEWKKLAKFMKLYRKEVDCHQGNDIDFETIITLRKQGKKFKEIAKDFLKNDPEVELKVRQYFDNGNG